MNRWLLTVVAVGVCAAGARGQAVGTRSQLENILGDQSFLEDFEGVSVAGGGVLSAPSPLNRASQPTWHLLAGPTYLTSGGEFSLFSGASNVLEALSGDLDITFARPQGAVGLDLVNGTGNLTFHYAVSFYSGDRLLGSLEETVPTGTQFVGWEELGAGITRVHIVAPEGEEIDDLEWGINVLPEPGSLGMATIGGMVLLERRRKR